MAIEQTMAQLAHSQVTQSLPSLADSIQGFQLIDSNEESNSAIGVIVALLGDTCIYVPAIYKHGHIYNMDIMYIPEMSQWLPTQDNWITYLKSRKPELMSVLRMRDAMVEGNKPGAVDLDIPFKHLAKSASDESGKQRMRRLGVGTILKEAREVLEAELDKPLTALDIPSAIEVMHKSAATGAAKILNSIMDNVELNNAFVQHYSNDDLLSIAENLAKKVEGGLLGSREKPKANNGAVKVLTGASSEAKDLSDDEKKKLLLNGAVIVDTRGLTPSKVFKAKNTGSWELVNSQGLYELLKADGNTLTAYVIPINHYGRERKAAIIPLDDGMSRLGYIRNIPVGQRYPMDTIPDHCGESISSFFTSAVIDGADSWRVIDAIISTPCGKSVRIYVNGGKPQVIGNVDGTTTLIFRDEGSYCDGNHIRRIEVLPKGAKLRINNNILYAPENAVAIKLAMDAEENKRNLNLSTFDELQTSVMRQEKLLGVKVTNQHFDFIISDDNNRVTEPLDKQAAAVDLVRHYAIDPDVAEKIMEEVGSKSVAQERYLVKIANDTGYMMMVNEQQEQVPEEVTLDLNQRLPQNDVQVLIDAGNTGVKEIMDVTVLKTLARDTSTVRQIQELVPRLFSALDAVARILFMIRAGDSMNDAYGTSRTDEMEDQFSRLVDSLGDAIICLQQGRVDSIHDLLEGPLASTLG